MRHASCVEPEAQVPSEAVSSSPGASPARCSGAWGGGGEGFLFYIFMGSAEGSRWASVQALLLETLGFAQL